MFGFDKSRVHRLCIPAPQTPTNIHVVVDDGVHAIGRTLHRDAEGIGYLGLDRLLRLVEVERQLAAEQAVVEGLAKKRADLKKREDGTVSAVAVETANDEVLKLKKEQFNLRFQRATGQLENTSRVRVVRREIARAKTIAAQKRDAAKK